MNFNPSIQSNWTKKVKQPYSIWVNKLNNLKKNQVILDQNNLYDFIKKNPDNIKQLELSYDKVSWPKEARSISHHARKVRLTTLNESVFEFEPGSTKFWRILTFSDKENLRVCATLKYSEDISETERLRMESYKTIRKFAALNFHPNLQSNEFAIWCSKLPKNYEQYVQDCESFEHNSITDIQWVKTIYNYWVTAWCEHDGKKVGEKKLLKIFWEYELARIKDALEKKESYYWFVAGAWDSSVPGSYDYSISCETRDWVTRLFYSEQYSWCLNGHYYVGNDYNSFIYIEKD